MNKNKNTKNKKLFTNGTNNKDTPINIKLNITDFFLPKESAIAPVGTSKKNVATKYAANANDNSEKLNPLPFIVFAKINFTKLSYCCG